MFKWIFANAFSQKSINEQVKLAHLGEKAMSVYWSYRNGRMIRHRSERNEGDLG